MPGKFRGAGDSDWESCVLLKWERNEFADEKIFCCLDILTLLERLVAILMNMQELKQLIYKGEKVDIECKEAENNVPRSVYESYLEYH